MPFLPVILGTDALVFLLLAACAVLAVAARRRDDQRRIWRRVGASRTGMSAATVLAVFVLIGVADSLHYRARLPEVAGEGPARRAWSVEVRSVLDLAIDPLRQRAEKTYSAPLDTHLFAKETVDRPGGTQVREYPRLRYGGAHLRDPVPERWPDVLVTVLRGAALALTLWICVAMAVVSVLALRMGRPRPLRRVDEDVHVPRPRAAPPHESVWRMLWRGETAFAWNAVLITLGVLLLVGVPVGLLAGKYHVFGTDKVGQDVLWLALKSIRTGLVIGTLTTLIMLPFAVLLGVAAGYFGGWVDDVIQYLYTTLNSIPGVLLIAAAVLMMQVVIENHPEWFATAAERADARLLSLCAILGITSWTGLCRLLRAETLKLRELEYVQAAQAFGVRPFALIRRHLLPNLFHIVLIAVVMDFSGLVLAEAVLSYVGIGVDPSTVSFGTMINNGRMELARDPVVWWSLAAAFCCMFALVLAANLFADVVRDAFDPRAARRVGPVAAGTATARPPAGGRS